MRKAAVLLGVMVAVAGASVATLPRYVGMQTEQHFHDQLTSAAAVENSAVFVMLVHYDRGWMRSSAVHRISLKADPEVYFDVHHDISHVPDPREGWVSVQSTPHWPARVQAAADYYFDNQPAIALNTVVGFDRQIDVTTQSPAFSKPMLTQPEVKLT